jgi:Periplasmic component of the Tol biopolymer transport system
MRSSVARRTALLAAAATSLALLMAACGSEPDPAPTEPDGDSVLGGISGLELAKGTLLISDGTPRVRIGDAIVTFPSSVTDAIWSPDGSRIAYIDGDGNVATARPNGTDVLVLTTTDPTVVRSRPTWLRQWILYAEAKADGTSSLRSVPANGCAIGDTPAAGQEWPMDTGDGTSYVDLAPSASATERPMRVAFQHEEPSGAEIWINDSNQRVPLTYQVTKGSEPALTLDGQKLAYVGPDGDIYVTLPGEAAPAGTRLTSGAGHPTRLAWSPDGQYIAYETAAAVQRVSAAGGANAPEDLAEPPGTPSYLYGQENTLFAVTGADPTALSVAASQARWPGTAAFMPGQGYLGAYTATIGLASQPPSPDRYGPLLLLGSADQLDPRVTAELGRIFGAVPPGSLSMRPRVYVDGLVSTAIDQELEKLGYEVVRGQPSVEPAVTDLCASNKGPALSAELVVVDGSDPVAVRLGRSFAGPRPMLVLQGGLTEEQATWLRRSSGVIESVYAIGSVPEDLQQQVAGLVAGPLGYTTTHNPISQAALY